MSHPRWLLTLLPLLTTACGATGVRAVMDAEIAAAQARQAEELARFEHLRAPIDVFLTDDLGVDPTVRDRLLANLGPHCSVLVDPQDPVDCAADGSPINTCRSMLLVHTNEGWSLQGMRLGVAYPYPDACQVGLLYPQEYRHMDSMARGEHGAPLRLEG